MKKRIFTLLLAVVALALGMQAKQMEPYEGSRIFWDTTTEQELFPAHGNYARIIQLADGRIMVAAEAGGGISVRYSSDYGRSWTSSHLIAPSANMLPYAVPDLAQLSDGTIIVGFNPRPSTPHSEDRKFGIRCVRSEDNGQTWSEPIFIFDGDHTGAQGCWEPSFLELPSGELHCYFANEYDFPVTGEQCISVSRSFDMGKTWSPAERVCFRPGTRDGMPVPILTEKGEIIVIIEDNGQPGYSGFRATTVRCTLEDNWKTVVDADSPNREIIFPAGSEHRNYKSAAPYLRQLWTGETIASWQGDHYDRKGFPEAQYNMFVAVGDKDARNFKAVTAPFIIPHDSHALWNSVTAVGDSSVIALASIGSPTKGNSIYMVKGYARKYLEAGFGTPEVDGTFKGDSYPVKNARQLTMGFLTDNEVNADFLYDFDNLYFTARVIDQKIFSDKADNDGIYLSLDTRNACDTYPQEGMFRFFLNVDGSLTMQYGNSNKWHKTDAPASIDYKVIKKSFYYDVEIAIPWTVLGYETAPQNNVMRVNVENVDREDGAISSEIIPETIARESWSWMEFRLNVPAKEKNIEAKKQPVSVVVSNGVIKVDSKDTIESLTLTAYNGVTLYKAAHCGQYHEISLPSSIEGGILSMVFANGAVLTRKMIF